MPDFQGVLSEYGVAEQLQCDLDEFACGERKEDWVLASPFVY